MNLLEPLGEVYVGIDKNKFLGQLPGLVAERLIGSGLRLLFLAGNKGNRGYSQQDRSKFHG